MTASYAAVILALMGACYVAEALLVWVAKSRLKKARRRFRRAADELAVERRRAAVIDASHEAAFNELGRRLHAMGLTDAEVAERVADARALVDVMVAFAGPAIADRDRDPAPTSLR